MGLVIRATLFGLAILTVSQPAASQDWSFVRGDCNADGDDDVSDAVYALNVLFNGWITPCEDACDSNDDGSLDISDPIGLLAWLFSLGPPLAAPFPDCGFDSTGDSIGCTGPVAGCPPAQTPPTIISTPPTAVDQDETLLYIVQVEDPDLGDSATFTLIAGPTDAAIEPVLGVLSWTATGSGPVDFTVRATDSTGLFDEQSFTVDVIDPNDPPNATDDAYFIAPLCLRSVDAAEGVLANDDDPDGDPITAELLTAPLHGTVALFPDGSFEYQHDGSPDPEDVFTYLVSDGVESTIGAVTLTIGAADDRFLDHFDQPTVDSARWVIVADGGTVELSGDSTLEIDTAAGTDVAFLRTATPLDATRSQSWQFAVRRVDGDLPDLITLWRSSTAPTGADSSSLDAQRLGALGLVDDGAVPSVRFRYDPSGGGTALYWQGDPNNVWAGTGDAVAPIRTGSEADWSIVGLEIDGELARFRFFAQHRVGTGIGDPSHGLSMNALSDWVSFDDAGGLPASDELWLTIGDRHDDAFSGLYEIEWIRHEHGAPRDGYTNARGSITTEYTLRHHRSYATQFIPDGRGEVMIGAGPTGSWFDHGIRKKNVIHASDGLYYIFYEGFDDTDATSIGLASSDSSAGPWTPHPANPILPRTLLPNGGVDYDVLTAPFVIQDLGETDPNREWKLLACGEMVGTDTHRMFLFTAPAPDGPWLREDGPQIDGSVLAESQLADWKDDGVCDPLVWFDAQTQLWNLYFSGLRQKETEFGPGGWQVGHATSVDLLNWTENPANPVIATDPLKVRSWTSVNGRFLTVSDALALEVDAPIVIRNGATLDGWATTRIRRIVGNELELYHEIQGIGGTGAQRTIAQLGNGSLSPMILIQEPNGCFRMFLTIFQPFMLGSLSGGFGNCELVGTMTAPTLQGPWTWDLLGTPCLAPNIWGASRAQENIRSVQVPTVR